MKFLPLAVFLLLAPLQLSYCPTHKTVYIEASKPIVRIPKIVVNYNALIDAIYQYESGRNPNAYHMERDGQPSIGGLQIRQCRVDHYNRLTGKNYTLNDMYDLNKAIEVFRYFTNHNGQGKLIAYKSYEQAAKDWNGGGSMTITYWERGIKPLLQT
jgi:hypothetical protein